MPKIPTNPHPLNQVRKALGWTQQKLADKCGVSAVAIKKIEGRDFKPGLDLVGRIMWVTGVDPDSLNGKVPTFNGQPYTAELGLAHIKAFQTKNKFGEVQADKLTVRMVTEWIELFGALMVCATQKNALYPAGFLFEQWAAGMIRDFKMGGEFSQVAADSGSRLEHVQNVVAGRKRAKSKKTKG